MSGWVLSLIGAIAVWEMLRPRHPVPWQRVVDLNQTPVRHLALPITRPSPRRTTGLAVMAATPVGRSSSGGGATDLGSVIDVLQVALSAGHSIHTALIVASRSVGNGPVAALISDVVDDVSSGVRLLDALGDRSTGAETGTRALFVTLSAALRSGTPVVEALQRLADAERARRRRRTQERVRRLPVTLLLPLVCLVLPAFVLLAIVPVLLTVASSGLVPVST